MAYPTGGTHLETTSDITQTRTRRAVFRVEVMLKEGNTLYWEDITPYVISASGSIVRSNPRFSYAPRSTARGATATASIVLRNADLRFSPLNTSSPYHGKRWTGWSMNPIRLRWGFQYQGQDELVPLFRGYVTRAVDSYGARTVTFECEDRSIRFREARASTSTYLNVAPRAYLQYLSTYGLMYKEFNASWNYAEGDLRGVILYSGTISGANWDMVQDSSANWPDNLYAHTASVVIGGETWEGVGQVRRIRSNTSNTLYVFPNFTIKPEAGSSYRIVLAQKLDSGSFSIPVCWCEDTSVWEEMLDVAEAQGGVIYFDSAGFLRFDDMHRLLTPERTSPVLTITVPKMLREGASIHTTSSEIVNHVVVRFSVPRSGAPGVVWEADDLHALPANSHADWMYQLEYPDDGSPNGKAFLDATLSSPAILVRRPKAKKDFRASSGVEDVTDKVTVTIDTARSSSQSVRLILTNTYSAPVFLTRLQIRGRAVNLGQAEEMEVRDRDSIRKFGRRSLTISNRYIQTPEQAYALGRAILDMARDPFPVTEVSIPAIPYLEPGDIITLSTSGQAPDMDYVIEAIRWSLPKAEGGASGAIQTLSLRGVYSLASGNYLILGGGSPHTWGTARRYAY